MTPAWPLDGGVILTRAWTKQRGKMRAWMMTVGNRAWMAEREKMRAWSGDRGKPCLDG